MVRVLSLFIVFGLIISAYFFLPQFSGEVLKEVFRKGTGCKVLLYKPRIDFLNLKASIEDVSIVCRGEEEGEGFFAKKIDAQIEFQSLLDKVIKISQLKIYGASAKSLSSESAFIKTLKFVLHKPERKKEDLEKRGWHAWVPKVEILGSEDMPSLVFGARAAMVRAHSLEFISEDPIDSPITPVTLRAIAKNAFFVVGNREIELGKLDFEASANLGVISFTQAILTNEQHQEQHQIEVKGRVNSKEELYDLRYNGTITLAQLGVLDEKIANEEIGFEGEVGGGINEPEVNSRLRYSKLNAALKLGADKERGGLYCSLNLQNLGNIEQNEVRVRVDQDKNKIELEKLRISKLPIEQIIRLAEGIGVYSNSILASLNPKGLIASELSLDGEGYFDYGSQAQSDLKLGGGFRSSSGVPSAGLSIKLENSDLEAEIRGIDKSLILGLQYKDKKYSGEVKVKDIKADKIFTFNENLKDVVPTLSLIGEVIDLEGSPGFLGKVVLGDSDKKDYLTFDLDLGPDKMKLNSDFTDLDLRVVPLLKDYVQKEILLSGALTFKGNLGDLFASEGLFKGSLIFPEEYSSFQPLGPVVISLINGKVKLEEIRLALPLAIGGSLDKSSGWKGYFRGDIPFANIVRGIDGLESSQGGISCSGVIEGELEEPQIRGEASFDDLNFNLVLAETILTAENVGGRIKFSGDKVSIEGAQGEIADGFFRIGGGVENLFSKEARIVEIFLDAKEMKVEPEEGLFLDLNANLAFGMHVGVPNVLRGRVEIQEAVYENEINLDTMIRLISNFIKEGLWSKGRSEKSTDLSGVVLDVHVLSEGGMLLDTNVLQGEFLGDVHLREDMANPYLEGKIKVLDGGFKVNQTEFQILSGELSFSDFLNAMDPKISLTSEGSLRNRSGDETKVFLSLGGSLKNTKVSLTSDGDGTAKDLARQLGVGAGGNQVRLVDDKLSNVGFRELLSPSSDLTILERVTGLAGFDDVRVETGVSVRTGEFVPQVYAGRPLPLDFRITLSSELSGDKASGAKLEYRLDDSFSVFTSWRSQAVTSASQTGSGNIGGGFQYKRTFKGLRLFPDSLKVSEEVGEGDE